MLALLALKESRDLKVLPVQLAHLDQLVPYLRVESVVKWENRVLQVREVLLDLLVRQENLVKLD